jgi:hypothetical protein
VLCSINKWKYKHTFPLSSHKNYKFDIIIENKRIPRVQHDKRCRRGSIEPVHIYDTVCVFKFAEANFRGKVHFGVYTNIRAILNSRRWLPKIMNSRWPLRLKNKENYCNHRRSSKLFSIPGIKQYAIVQKKTLSSGQIIANKRMSVYVRNFSQFAL